jgi:uncharacterized protein with ParB-like and HNH nuclease domain
MNELVSLQNIFKDKIFRIPDYQRGYAWTTRQLKDFWEDVVNLPSDRFHYTGLLSLKKVKKNVWDKWNDERWLIKDRGFKPFHIVDGQQRLTTFVIFIQAIYELLKNIPENKDKKDSDIYLGSFSLKDIKEEYLVVVRPPQFIIKTYKFGYEIDNPSFQFLKYSIFKEQNSGTIQETFYTLNLENSKNFYTDNLSNYHDEYGITGIEKLFKVLTQNLMFNVYEISDDFDVFVAFETMNNRGKTLATLELLKNRLIYLTTLFNNKELKTDERVSLRGEINDAWKEVYFQLGRNKLKLLNDDTFLQAHWIMYFQYTRARGENYKQFLLEKKFTPQNIYTKTQVKLSSIQDFEEIIGDEEFNQEEVEVIYDLEEMTIFLSKLTPKEIKDYVISLKSASKHWYNTYNPINNPNLTHQESDWIDRLNRIGIMYFRPLVTASYLSNNIDTKKQVQLFKAIERFIFITFRLGRASSNYRNSEFYRAARELRNNDLTVDEIIEKLEEGMEYCFSPQEDTDDLFFNYTYFKNHLVKKFKGGGGFYYWNGLRYFLYEYEMEQVRKMGSQKIDWKPFIKGEKDKISIEHIYPQTPDNKYWKSRFKGLAKSKRMFLQGSLGNLLPLSLSVNSSLQNDSFDDKKRPKKNERNEIVRQGYSNGSHSEKEVAEYKEWTPNEIFERGKKLIEFMEVRWDLKFEDDSAKAELLFLDFMIPENEIQQTTVIDLHPKG